MKKVFAIILATVIVFSCMPLYSVSAEDAQAEFSPSLQEPSELFYNIECIYSEEASTIDIKFRMRSRDVETYKASEILIYRIAPGQDLEVVGTENAYVSVSGVSPSNRSDLRIKHVTLEERLSGYVIALEHNGERICSDVFYPHLSGTPVGPGFKGIESGSSSYCANVNADICIHELQIDKLESNGSGYLYSTDMSTYTFNKQYLSCIDNEIKSCSDSGAEVYIRVTDKEGDSVFTQGSYKSISDVYAYISFVCERYSDETNGRIAGLIFGDYTVSLEPSFADNYAKVLYAALAAVKDSDTELSVIVPIADSISTPMEFLSSLCDELHLNVSQGFSVMLESIRNPYGIDREHTNAYDEVYNSKHDGEDGDNMQDDYDEPEELPDNSTLPELLPNTDASGYISAENISTLISAVKRLNSEYLCVSSSVLYNWIPEYDGTTGNAALASYVYNYCSLFVTESVSKFIVTIPSDLDSETRNLILNAVFYIDSNRFKSYINEELTSMYFGADNLEELISGFSSSEISSKNVYIPAVMKNEPYNIFGTSNYFDFSTTSQTSGWNKGAGCSLVSSVRNASGRYMSAKMSSDNGKLAFLYYNYQYSESFKYTDYISFTFMIECEDPNAVFNLGASIGGEGFDCEYKSYTYYPGSFYTVYLNTIDLTEKHAADYIRFGFYSQSNDPIEYRILISSIDARSRTYDSKSLESFIESERDRLKSSAQDELEKNINVNAILAVAFVILATVMIMFMLSRKRRI